MKKILGISAFYHDAAAAIIVDGKIIAAAQEERFTRIKNTADFPTNAITYCLQEAALEINDLDAIVFYDKPLLKFERLLQTYYAFAPKGLLSFLKAMPIWLKEKLFLKKIIKSKLQEISFFDAKKVKLLFTEHHLSHAASVFYTSNFNNAAILTIDGVGEWCTLSIGVGNGNKISILKQLFYPNSVGLLYSAFTYYLGFTVNSGEYKLMGLSPYGIKNSTETIQYINTIKAELIDIKNDGSIWLNTKYFEFATGLKMVNNKKWHSLFGLEKRNAESNITQQHCNMALAIQIVVEEILLKLANEAKKITGLNNLCLAGGVALNCVANSKLLQQNIFDNIFIQPACGDAGGALGAALAANYIYYNEERNDIDNITKDALQGSYLGPSFTNAEIENMCKHQKAVYTFVPTNNLYKLAAEKIAENKVVGWFQGKMEYGPRALGNRSILASPINAEMQKTVNLKIKKREAFRPFAPSILAEKASDYFNFNYPSSPYMLFVADVAESKRKQLPENYSSLNLWDKLYTERSIIQSVTHVDFSARLQTVHKETNEKFYNLIKAFEEITGHPLLLNTSFNVRGEPIVCTPLDAYKCFMNTDMDYLVIENYFFAKEAQPIYFKKDNVATHFKQD